MHLESRETHDIRYKNRFSNQHVLVPYKNLDRSKALLHFQDRRTCFLLVFFQFFCDLKEVSEKVLGLTKAPLTMRDTDDRHSRMVVCSQCIHSPEYVKIVHSFNAHDEFVRFTQIFPDLYLIFGNGESATRIVGYPVGHQYRPNLTLS